MTRASTTGTKAPKPHRSAILMTFREFAFVEQLRPEEIAGFRVWLSGQEHHRETEWRQLLAEYRNR